MQRNYELGVVWFGEQIASPRTCFISASHGVNVIQRLVIFFLRSQMVVSSSLGTCFLVQEREWMYLTIGSDNVVFKCLEGTNWLKPCRIHLQRPGVRLILYRLPSRESSGYYDHEGEQMDDEQQTKGVCYTHHWALSRRCLKEPLKDGLYEYSTLLVEPYRGWILLGLNQ